MTDDIIANQTDDGSEAPAAPVRSARSGMIRSSMVYSSLTLVSRLMGFVRDLVITYYMGASATFVADAYTTAFAFPNLFRRIFAEGAFAAAFVPAYARSLERDGEEVADVLAADAMAALLAMTVGLTIVAELAMPWIIAAYSPGFAATPGKSPADHHPDDDHHALPALHGDLRPPGRGAERPQPVHPVGGRADPAQRLDPAGGPADPHPARRRRRRLLGRDRRRDHPGRPAVVGGAPVGRQCELAAAALHPGDPPADRPGPARRLRRQRQPDQRLRLPVPGQPRQRGADLAGGVRPALSVATGPGRRRDRRRPPAAPVPLGARRRRGGRQHGDGRCGDLLHGPDPALRRRP